MNGLAYISENKIFCLKNDKSEEIPCGRLENYKSVLADIRRRNEWKSSGTGAQFMNQIAAPEEFDNMLIASCEITGLACFEGQLVYGVRLDESGGIYIRSADRSQEPETLVISGKDIFPGRMSCCGDKLSVSCGENRLEKHISVYTLPSSHCREYTDGDTIEESPREDGGSIYFSTAGYARNPDGSVAAVQNKSIVKLDTAAGRMDEVLSDEKYDFLCPFPDGIGGIYCIRQPAGGENSDNENLLKDVVMFPIRIIKAIGGFLDMFSIIFGGESLRSDGKSFSEKHAEKAMRKSRKEMLIDGNIINAEKNMKAEQNSGEKYPGIMPQSRVLIHADSSGNIEVIRKGVLDFILLSDGNLAVSNGGHILIADRNGTTLKAYKADKASALTEIISAD